MNIIIDEILKLSIPDRIRIANQIWTSIPKEKISPSVSEEVQILLTGRLKKFKESPNLGISLEESKKRIKTKIEIYRKNRTRRSK